jgi:hypothetical protein
MMTMGTAARAVANRLQNLLGRSRKVRAHVSSPAIHRFTNHQDQNLPARRTVGGLKHLHLLGMLLVVKRYFYREPAFLLGGFMAKINALAIFTWSSASSLLNRLGQRTESRILSQAGNNGGSCFNDRFEKSSFSIAAIGDYPKFLSQAPAAVLSPFDQFRRLLQFILESYAVICGYLGYIFCANIHFSQKRQANGKQCATYSTVLQRTTARTESRTYGSESLLSSTLTNTAFVGTRPAGPTLTRITRYS